MAKIKINNDRIVNGKLTITRGYDENNLIVVGAILQTHRYFEEITDIETERYKLLETEIIKEDFGSNDFDILYTLKAKDLEILGGETNLPEYIIEQIEKKVYKEEQQELFHKEVYEKIWK